MKRNAVRALPRAGPGARPNAQDAVKSVHATERGWPSRSHHANPGRDAEADDHQNLSARTWAIQLCTLRVRPRLLTDQGDPEIANAGVQAVYWNTAVANSTRLFGVRHGQRSDRRLHQRILRRSELERHLDRGLHIIQQYGSHGDDLAGC